MLESPGRQRWTIALKDWAVPASSPCPVVIYFHTIFVNEDGSYHVCAGTHLGRVVLSVVGETSNHHHYIHLQSSLSYCYAFRVVRLSHAVATVLTVLAESVLACLYSRSFGQY